MSDHWYDETATDLLCGVVVDEEPEPVTVPLSQAVLDHLHRELAARNRRAPHTPRVTARATLEPNASRTDQPDGATPPAPSGPVPTSESTSTRPAWSPSGS